MEAWLTELEMEINNQSESLMEACFDEELAATLGEDFPYPHHENNQTQWDLDYDIIDQLIPNNTTNLEQEIQNSKEEPRNEGRKMKRQPSQVQDHIIAERKRRELLGQLFISLSAILPSLKKTDKTSVLGEAIKYMKQLKEKVKVLEEMAAKRTVESMVVVKKSRMIIENDSHSSGDENDSSCIMDHNSNHLDLLPEIEAKISENTLLLRVYCENTKGIMSKLFTQIDKHDLSILSCSVIPFESLALDITIAAQMKTGFNANIKAFVRNLRSSLR